MDTLLCGSETIEAFEHVCRVGGRRHHEGDDYQHAIAEEEGAENWDIDRLCHHVIGHGDGKEGRKHGFYALSHVKEVIDTGDCLRAVTYIISELLMQAPL